MSRFRLTTWMLLLTASIVFNPSFASADVVLDWNVIALKTTASAPFNPPLEARNLAIVHAAVFDAVNAITAEAHPYRVRLRAPGRASAEAAAIAAAYAVLAQLYPEQQSTLHAAYTASLNAIGDGPAKAGGVALGNAVSAQMLATRMTDGAAEAVGATYIPGDRPGDWRPTPSLFAPALDPGWGRVRPFLLRHAAQFRPGPPPALSSRRYARDFDEIKAIGSSASTERGQDRTDVAQLWVATGAQNWNPVARQVSIAQGLTVAQNARAFALLNLAGADAFIAAWDAKFAYNQWRPVTAIRAAETDGNPATDTESDWTPLLPTPPFPDYIAGHTTYAGAAQAVLEYLFGKDPAVAIMLTSATAPGVVKTYTTFKDIADDVVEARVWGGVHWRTSSVRGRVVGERIGRFAVRRFNARTDDAQERVLAH